MVDHLKVLKLKFEKSENFEHIPIGSPEKAGFAIRIFSTILVNLFESLRTSSDLFGPLRISSDLLQTLSNLFNLILLQI